jgi:hypothetical protein
MGVTVTPLEAPRAEGNRRKVRATVLFDSSYPTGGEAVTAQSFGLSEIFDLTVLDAAGYDPAYDAPNKKIVMRWGDNNNAADAPGVQVADTTDLSAVTIRVEAQGY